MVLKLHHYLITASLILYAIILGVLLALFAKDEVLSDQWILITNSTSNSDDQQQIKFRGFVPVCSAILNILVCWLMIQRIIRWKRYSFFIEDINGAHWNQLLVNVTFFIIFSFSVYWILAWINMVNPHSKPNGFTFPGITPLSWWMTGSSVCLVSVASLFLAIGLPIIVCLIFQRACEGCHFSCMWILCMTTCSQLCICISDICRLSDATDEEEEEPAFRGFLPPIAVETKQTKQTIVNYGSITSFRKRENESHCCICLNLFLDDDALTILPCFHYLHSECYNQMISLCRVEAPQCPLCKTRINS